MTDERMCDVVGFSGERTAITQTVTLSFSINNHVFSKRHKFAIVSNNIIPNCFLLGLDFMNTHDISVDFYTDTCRTAGMKLATLNETLDLDYYHSVLVS